MKLFEDETFLEGTFQANDLGAEYIDCRFEGIDFQGVDLKGSRFIDCEFVGCNLGNVRVTGVTFRDATFHSSKVVGVNFSSCNGLTDLSFDDCALDYCVFLGMEIPGLRATRCSLKEVEFSEAIAKKSAFTESDLLGANFTGADLSGADFRGALNYQIDPRYTKIKKAKFSMPEAMALLDGLDIILDS